MAIKVCAKCKEEKTLANYIAVKSPFHCGTLPICRDCIANIIAAAPEERRWNTVNKLCQWADVPFIPEEWEKVAAKNGRNSFGIYVAIFRNEEFKTLNWNVYNEAYLQLREEERVEDAVPALQEKRKRDLQRKWGLEYDDYQIEYLENLHQGILNSQNIVGALNEDQALKLCKISLIIEEKIRAGEDFSKELKSYDSLSALANFTPKNVKDANEFDSFGEVFAYLEKTGWTNTYYDGAVRDEVDNTEKNIKNWLRYLYVNETGIAEEINERIENLKVAAELTDENFDEKEFRQYMDEEEVLEKEDFKIDLDD